MEKHIHRIIINKQKKYKYSYTYNFGHTKDVLIELSANSIRITAMLKKLYDKNEMVLQNCYLFPDAIKKALTLHLILFSENIAINKMSVQIDDEIDTVIDVKQGQASPIFSMVDKKLYHEIEQKWSGEEIKGFLSLTKSSNDTRLAALNGFIISKSKMFETERFIYLWTAFNGMYNYLSSEILGKKKDIREKDQILLIQKFYGLGNELARDTKGFKIEKELANIVKALIYHRYDRNKRISKNSLENGEYSDLNNYIKTKLNNKNTGRPYDISPYGYLLTQFSYYFRCNIIHGDKPYALFSYAEESEIKCLKCINELLDEFIENNLHLWFDENYVADLKKKAEKFM